MGGGMDERFFLRLSFEFHRVVCAVENAPRPRVACLKLAPWAGWASALKHLPGIQ